MNAIETKSLSVARDGHAILDDVSLALEPGQLVGLVGPNGVGKTTLLRALLRLIPRQAGDVMLNGKALDTLSAAELARTVAYLSQDHTVHWPLGARRVVELGRLPHLDAWRRPRQQDEEIVTRVMRETETDGFADRPITTLSGGERTRVLLARMLATEAPILLADEPTASLDPFHQLHVMELLRNAVARGAIVLVVLHDLPLASRFCDRVCLLHEGTCVAEGSPADVLSESTLAEVYRVDSLHGEYHGDRYVLPWARRGPASVT